VLGVRVTTPARLLVDVTRSTGRLDQIERGIAEAIELTRDRRAWFLGAFEAAVAHVSADNPVR